LFQNGIRVIVRGRAQQFQQIQARLK
jgi:hypothetical protein